MRDLLFRVKLEAALAGLGIPFRRTGSAGVLATLAAEIPAAVILDLADPVLEPLETVRAMRSRPDFAAVPVLGVAPHRDGSLIAAGRAAGCTRVVARSRAAADLPRLLAGLIESSGSGRAGGRGAGR